MNKKLWLILGTASGAIAGSGVLHAQSAATQTEVVVVTATRGSDGVRADVLGTSFSVLEPEDLENRQVRYVSDVLRDIPGISVSRTGTLGGPTQVRMRGAEGNHTLVLIDGMEASDPYLGEFDFATLIADDVARVEVLRGQQSALYGSDAIGGVINYITLGGREAPGVRARVEGGSFGTADFSARAAGVSGALDYAFSGGYTTTGGVPTAREGRRDVGSDNTAASARLLFTPSDVLRVKAIARYSRTDAETNDQDFDFPPGPTYGYVIDSDGEYENRAVYGLLRGEHDSLDGRWTNALSLQAVDAEREGFFDGGDRYGDEGGRQRYSFESTLRFGNDSLKHSLTGAFDYEREEFQDTDPDHTPEQRAQRTTTNKGLVLQYEATVNERIGFGAALRRDENDRFDDDSTYRVQGSYRFENGVRLHAATGSGIKNPGLFELFGFDPDSFVSNPNLKPEKSTGWEIGVGQRFAQGRASIDVTYFDNELKDEISTVFLPSFVFSPVNLETDSTQEGVEVSFSADASETWTIDASYTYLDAKQNGGEEVRRPPHIASLNVAWQAPDERFGVDLTVRYNGETLDNDFRDPFAFEAQFVTLKSYTLVNLGADWKVSDTVQVYGRVENLLDEDYEEVFTYRTSGIGAYAGVRLRF